MTLALDQLKTKHRAMWAAGDYPTVAADLLPELGEVLVEACHVGAADRVLDVAAGSGTAAIPAARTGARVIASDLTPELLDAGRTLAAQRGLDLDWQEADAEELPYPDGGFDVVMSCLGVMFAPNHRASADELLRVCRPGGTVGLLSWTPQGFIGQMFAAMKPYAPPPPPGAQPPPLWGDADHVRDLFADAVTDVQVRRQALRVRHFATPEGFREYFKTHYGPTIAAYRNLADDPQRTAALDRDLADLARRNGADTGAMDWEYLLLTARRTPASI
jgi:ubiquinone/menaquinone biosynthesis C-methylase UbiE